PESLNADFLERTADARIRAVELHQLIDDARKNRGAAHAVIEALLRDYIGRKRGGRNEKQKQAWKCHVHRWVYSESKGTINRMLSPITGGTSTMTRLLIVLLLASAAARADRLPEPGGRLLATGGVTQIEGAAGGGLVPWALIAGYGTRDQVGLTVYYTAADPTDFRLRAAGLAIGIHDRLELSVAQQRFGLGSTVPGEFITQDLIGLKLRLVGDAVFDQDRWWPQLAAGLM